MTTWDFFYKASVVYYHCDLSMWYKWKSPRSKGVFTVISPPHLQEMMCLFRSFGQGVVGSFTPPLSFQSHRALTFPCRRWVSSCYRLFLRWSPPFMRSNCFTHNSPTLEKSSRLVRPPKIAQGVDWQQTPVGSKRVMCSTLYSHNTDRGTGEAWRSRSRS